jgi:hypothetical protein
MWKGVDGLLASSGLPSKSRQGISSGAEPTPEFQVLSFHWEG